MMTKEELIQEISITIELGLPENMGGNDNIQKHCYDLVDKYVENLNDDKNIRLISEFDNYKKRVKSEIKSMESKIQYDTLSDFINILDDWSFFERVVGSSNNSDIKTGFNLIDKKIKSFLSNSKIEEIPTEIYDIDIHEVISLIDNGSESGSIINVISRGYKMEDRIMKYPKVIVQK